MRESGRGEWPKMRLCCIPAVKRRFTLIEETTTVINKKKLDTSRLLFLCVQSLLPCKGRSNNRTALRHLSRCILVPRSKYPAAQGSFLSISLHSTPRWMFKEAATMLLKKVIQGRLHPIRVMTSVRPSGNAVREAAASRHASCDLISLRKSSLSKHQFSLTVSGAPN